MWQRGMANVAAGTALFGVAHSALAGVWVKDGAARVAGAAATGGLHRLVYTLASAALLTALVAYARRQPGRDVYRVRGPAGWALRAGQVAALAYAGVAVSHIGVDHLTGVGRAAAWAGGAAVPPVQDGQGPVAGPDGAVRATGPFAHSRNPLNLFFVALVWLNPRMPTQLLAFNLVITAYAVVGSARSEARMADTVGAGFRDYQRRVPFLLPDRPPRASELTPDF